MEFAPAAASTPSSTAMLSRWRRPSPAAADRSPQANGGMVWRRGGDRRGGGAAGDRSVCWEGGEELPAGFLVPSILILSCLN